MAKTEAGIQGAFFNYVNFMMPESIARAITHIPNGERRDPKTAVKLRQMGVKAGWPDVIVALPRQHYHGMFIEMKRPNETASAAQVKVHRMLRMNGYRVEVCDSTASAIRVLEDYVNADE